MAVTFDSIGNGHLAEQFRIALAKVAMNIMDPNMDPKKARRIKIEIVFKPNGGGAIDTDYDVKPDLAGFAKANTTFLIGQDARTGRIQMSEYGSGSTPSLIAGEQQSVQTEVVVQPQPVQPFDPATGEIYEPSNGPIDLRKSS